MIVVASLLKETTKDARDFSSLVLIQEAIKITHNDLIGSYLQVVAMVNTSIYKHCL